MLAALRSRLTLERLVAPFDDPNVDDGMLGYMVKAVYGPRSTLLTSTVMALVFPLMCWVMTGGRSFLVLAMVEAGVGIARFDIYERFHQRPIDQLDRRALLVFDGWFTVWSAACMFGIGLACAELVRWTHVPSLMTVAAGAAVGFPYGAASRNAARRTVQIAQISAVLVPFILAMLMTGSKQNTCSALLMLGVFMSTVANGRANCARVVELYRMNEANARLARSDSLTGALNRYAFDSELAAAITKVEAVPGKRLALITADIDRFKQINDTAGHAVGDAVIVATTARLKRAAPADALVARLGGDEFAAIFRCASVEDAGRLAQGIVDTIGAPLEIDGLLVPIGASVGVAVAPDHGSEASALMKRSDVALYAAKHDGRGRCVVYDGRLAMPKAEPIYAVGGRR